MILSSVTKLPNSVENKSRSKFKQRCQLVTFYTVTNACMYLFLTLFFVHFMAYWFIYWAIYQFLYLGCWLFLFPRTATEKSLGMLLVLPSRGTCAAQHLSIPAACGHGCVRTDSAVCWWMWSENLSLLFHRGQCSSAPPP